MGKTTVAAGLCLALSRRAYEILALDCDPDGDLAEALGFPTEKLASLRPLSELTELIEERTGAKPGGYSSMFKLSPHVADIPDTHCVCHGRVKLLAMDTISEGGSGCACPQNVLFRRLVGEILVSRQEAVVMDMEAGLEHLGRATAGAVSCLIAVIEPGLRSIKTAQSILRLAGDLGIPRCFVLGNRFRPDDDFSAFWLPHFSDNQLLGCIAFDQGIAAADRSGMGIEQGLSAATREQFIRMLDRLEEETDDL